MRAKFWKELILPPNLLTLCRILLVPVFVRMMLAGRARDAFLVFLLAGLTDVLDGLAARLRHQKSRLGLWLDPLADKLLLTSAFVLLGLTQFSRPNAIPLTVVFIVIGRDICIAAGALILLLWKRQKAFFPTLLGKVSTVTQVLTILAVLVLNARGTAFPLLSWAYDATLVATIASGVQYFILSLPLLANRKKA
jgi:cardiolipin synthase (CMP-forming)